MVLNLFQDSLPHVRLSAINSTGRLSTNLDQDLQFQYHNHVPALATAISDFIHEFRLARAVSAMVNISKNYVHDILTPYLHGTVSNLLQFMYAQNDLVWDQTHSNLILNYDADAFWQNPSRFIMVVLERLLLVLKLRVRQLWFLSLETNHFGDNMCMLGVSPPPILVEEFSLKKLVSAIEFMLKPEVKVSATELAKAMANENGVKGVVDAQPLFNETVSRLHLIFRSLGDLINKGDFQLAWIFRLKIAIGIAQGLPYLHKDYVPHLLHRDVKSRNVLLDNEFEPKLTDLALDTILGENAFRSSLDSKSGSSCYIAPEFGYNKKATEQMDTYVFGVILLELVTGRPTEPIDSSEDSLNIVKWVRRKVNISNGSVQVLDQKISSSCKQEALGMLEIALQCTSVVPEKRPSMWEVVAALQFLGSKTRVPENGVKINLMCERIQVSMREI
ncbi:probably inactive leucine-rich repeat receptor-like protein kinase [Tanacetum coccineum]